MVLVVAVALADALSLAGISVAASSESVSSRKVDALQIEEFGAYNALGEISQRAHVVIGLDAIQPRSEATITLDFPGGTVSNLLDAFVSRVPDYKWRETDGGIIHVVSSKPHDSLASVLMTYPGASKKTRQEVWRDLATRPEVESWMRTSGCARGELFNGKEFRDHNEPITIEPGRITVARLLDEAASKSGVDFWAVLQSPPGTSCTVQIILW
jgi:hypothetical protein